MRFTTASGGSVPVSEASKQKAKGTFNDPGTAQSLASDEEMKSRKTTSFGFSTVLGNEIVVSEESMKRARKILNEVDVEECSFDEKVGGNGIARRVNVKNSKETNEALNNAKFNDHTVCGGCDVRLSSKFQKDIAKLEKSPEGPELSLCDETSSTLKRIAELEQENDIKTTRRTHKRLSSEIEDEYGKTNINCLYISCVVSYLHDKYCK